MRQGTTDGGQIGEESRTQPSGFENQRRPPGGEDVFEDDDIAFQPDDLGDASDVTGAARLAGLLHDDVQRCGDLLAYDANG